MSAEAQHTCTAYHDNRLRTTCGRLRPVLSYTMDGSGAWMVAKWDQLLHVYAAQHSFISPWTWDLGSRRFLLGGSAHGSIRLLGARHYIVGYSRMTIRNGQCKLSVSSNKNTTNLSHFNQRHDGLIFKPPFGFCHCVFSMQLECSNCSILVANISK